MTRWVCVIPLVVLSAGCSSYAVPRYGVAVTNVTALKQAANGQKVAVGKFTAVGGSKSDIMCRGVGPIKTPDERPFEEYVRKALIDEMQLAEMYADGASVTLTGSLDKVDFNSSIFGSEGGKWFLGLTVTSSNGSSLSVAGAYDYNTHYFGEKACALTAQAFGPAVQSLIGKLVHDPSFPALLK